MKTSIPLGIGATVPSRQHSENDPWWIKRQKITAKVATNWLFSLFNIKGNKTLGYTPTYWFNSGIRFQRTLKQMNWSMTWKRVQHLLNCLELKHSTNKIAFSIGLYVTLPSSFSKGGTGDSYQTVMLEALISVYEDAMLLRELLSNNHCIQI